MESLLNSLRENREQAGSQTETTGQLSDRQNGPENPFLSNDFFVQSYFVPHGGQRLESARCQHPTRDK